MTQHKPKPEKQYALPLQQVISFLEKNEIQHTVQNASQQVPFDLIFIAMGSQDEAKSMLLQIHHYNQELIVPEEIRQEKNLANQSLGTLHILQFIFSHPTQLTDDSYGEIGRLLMFANKSIPLGSLMYSEVEKCCYYQFSYPSTTETIQHETLQAIFNTIVFVQEIFFDLITNVAEKKISVDEIIRSAMQESMG